MKPMRHHFLTALILAAASAGTALAQPAPSAEGAKSLEKQIRDALASTGMGSVPARPVEMTPDGDHYTMRVPMGEWGKVEPADAAYTANVHMLDGTKWAIDNARFPSDFKITSTMMVPDAPDTKKPSKSGTHSEPLSYSVKIGQQEGHGTFDPTFATATSNDGTISSVDILRTLGSTAKVSHIDKVTSHSATRPIDPAHIDAVSDISAENYASEAALPDGSTFKMTAKAVHVSSDMTGLAHQKVLPLLHEALAVIQMKPPGDDVKKQVVVNAALRKLLVTAKNLLTGLHVEETGTDIKFDIDDHVGSLTHAVLGLGGDAPQDMLSANMNFILDGLVLADLPPAFAAYVPTHFSIHPTMSNLSVSGLTKMAMDATASPGGSVPPADFASMFSKGGINIGFDSLGLDIAGAQFSGNGKFVMTGPQSVDGQSEITAHGLDGLIEKAQGDPLLAQGLPVIIFLKGIAHTSGDSAVWLITVAKQKVLVNNVDTSAMLGGMK